MTKGLFLDRDGVINVDKGYVHRIEDFEFLPGIFAFCRRASVLGYKIFVVTNQSGIARGFYTEHTFLMLTTWMKQRFVGHGVHIEAVFFCPHHPSEGQGQYLQACECRKPQPGMLKQALRDYDLEASECLLIGDSSSDIDAARCVGMPSVKVSRNDIDFTQLQAVLK
ncbi:D-glycero-alpha-D-manno-heptose-1,7-bisphosphate 7-phosphatase [Marinagarivorans algicola]|uniref:D-glycero-alpha-D-manno-heptose-1,7-bisphosphate 7-phosphatase n=1 Tax=Marinagarivorans algicola TaxID=1513270 RepID=UPI003735081B